MIYFENIITVCNAVFFRLCIDLINILPPVTTEGLDGSHHPRFAECMLRVTTGGIDKLKLQNHISKQILKANKILGLIKRTFKHLDSEMLLFVQIPGETTFRVLFCSMDDFIKRRSLRN